MYALRWFTPGGEVNLCGHATLAASFALWEEGMVGPATAIRFSTASGVLTCRRDGEGWVEMDFPAHARRFLPLRGQIALHQERECCILPPPEPLYRCVRVVAPKKNADKMNMPPFFFCVTGGGGGGRAALICCLS